MADEIRSYYYFDEPLSHYLPEMDKLAELIASAAIDRVHGGWCTVFVVSITPEWCRRCARALVSLETRRPLSANSDSITSRLIRQSIEFRSEEQKNMTAFFMPNESLSDDELLAGAGITKAISYMEILKQERELLGNFMTIHPVDLAVCCQLLHIPWLSKKSDEILKNHRDSKEKRGRKKKD